jgi:hypothetical protein
MRSKFFIVCLSPIVIGIVILGQSVFSSPSDPCTSLNLDFEQVTQNGTPLNWDISGGYDTDTKRHYTPEEKGWSVKLDSTTVHQGKYSLMMEVLPKGTGGAAGEGCFSFLQGTLLKNIRGKVITYSGWIKTQNITHDAGLWMTISGRKSPLPLYANNMYDSLIDGTRDWKKYSISTLVSDEASEIEFGVGLFSPHGGKAWFDDLSIDTNGVSCIH